MRRGVPGSRVGELSVPVDSGGRGLTISTIAPPVGLKEPSIQVGGCDVESSSSRRHRWRPPQEGADRGSSPGGGGQR